MDNFCPSFESIHTKRNKLKRLEEVNKKSVSEQLRTLNETALSLNPNGKTGVYVFHSKSNDMIYIGSAENSIKGRYNSHIKDLTSNEHANWQFQLIYHKYGIENLDFYVIEFCSPKDCKKRESYYISDLIPEINIADVNPITEEDYTEFRKRVEFAQAEWHQTVKGFDWQRKRVSHWFKHKDLRETLRGDMNNLWDRLDKQKMTEDEKFKELIKIYKAFLPEKYWQKSALLEFIKEKTPIKTSKEQESYTNITKQKSKSQINQESKEKAEATSGCLITIIFLIVVLILWWLLK